MKPPKEKLPIIDFPDGTRDPICVGYVRASTAKQETSLEVQETQSREYARLYLPHIRWIGCVFDAATSARIPFLSRVQGCRLSNALRAGDHVVITKTDRAFRNTVDCLQTIDLWNKTGIFVHILDMRIDTSIPAGRLMVTMLSGLAEFENSRRSERVREAVAQRKANGTWWGLHKLRIGEAWKTTREDGVRVADHYTLETCRVICELRCRQGFSAERIWSALLQSKIKNKQGKQWSPKSILKMHRQFHYYLATQFPKGYRLPTGWVPPNVTQQTDCDG